MTVWCDGYNQVMPKNKLKMSKLWVYLLKILEYTSTIKYKDHIYGRWNVPLLAKVFFSASMQFRFCMYS